MSIERKVNLPLSGEQVKKIAFQNTPGGKVYVVSGPMTEKELIEEGFTPEAAKAITRVGRPRKSGDGGQPF